MIACVNVMIDNVDAYIDWRTGICYGHADVFRKLSAGDLRHATDDIDGIEQAAIECVDIVDMHSHTK